MKHFDFLFLVFFLVSPLFAGVATFGDIEVYAELTSASGFWQTSDWISADVLISQTAVERKTLDEIEIMTGFHNFVDYQVKCKIFCKNFFENYLTYA